MPHRSGGGHYKCGRRVEHATIVAVTLPPTSRAALLDVARRALLHRLNAGGAPPLPPDRPPEWCPELTAPCGCFVSLHEHGTGKLRGCVGRLDATRPVWEAVRITAGDVLHDPRFVSTNPVTPADVPHLEIEVSVLSPPRAAASPTDFSLLDDGIYLTLGKCGGFFLPQVARDTGWSKEQLLARLCTEKVGVAADAWKLPEARLYTFDVEVIGPAPLIDAPP